MIKQIRIYTINRGYLKQFADEWNRNVVPLRAEHRFEVLEAWLIEETNQFVWLLGYSGKGSWSEAETAYYASVARSVMDPNPARLIARPEEYFVEKYL